MNENPFSSPKEESKKPGTELNNLEENLKNLTDGISKLINQLEETLKKIENSEESEKEKLLRVLITEISNLSDKLNYLEKLAGKNLEELIRLEAARAEAENISGESNENLTDNN